MSDSGAYLRLTDPSGASIPVFVVEVGQRTKNPPIKAKLNNVTYSVPRGDFEGGEGHFTTRAVSIVKDIITLNTTQGQLPTGTTVFVGGPIN